MFCKGQICDAPQLNGKPGRKPQAVLHPSEIKCALIKVARLQRTDM